MLMISAANLQKTFRRPHRVSGPLGGLRTFFTRQMDETTAVHDVSFSVQQGELVGYLGSNGAGKSTTIKMLAGILVPSGGTATVNGIVPWEQRERNARNVGVVFGQRTQLWWDLPLIDSFRIIAKLYEVDDTRLDRALKRLDDQLEFSGFLQTPVRQLSLGQRMRGDLAAAMLYNPAVLYLDEPTIGLDVVARERMRAFVEHTNRQAGTTIMLTTHDLADVERLCQRIIFIDHGRVLFDGAITELVRRYAPWRELRLTLAPGSEAPALALPGVEMALSAEGQVRLRFDPAVTAVPEVIRAVMAEASVMDLELADPTLEAIVREIEESGAVRG